MIRPGGQGRRWHETSGVAVDAWQRLAIGRIPIAAWSGYALPNCGRAVRRLLTATAAAVLLGGPAKGELIIISTNTIQIPPYSVLRESIKRLNGTDVTPARYITFLGTWENNCSANWERETW